jgi:hypothetical protein
MRCTGGARHWFSLAGLTGVRTPVCVRCGEPNPRKLSDAEWADLAYWRGHRYLSKPVEIALREHQVGSQQ